MEKKNHKIFKIGDAEESKNDNELGVVEEEKKEEREG